MPPLFEVSDRIQVHRLGKRAGVVSPAEVSMSDVVSFITGAEEIPGSGSIDAAS
jgi:fructose transport system ATP-binding protein